MITVLSLVFTINGAVIAAVPAWNGSQLECTDRARLIELLLNDDRKQGVTLVHVECQMREVRG